MGGKEEVHLGNLGRAVGKHSTRGRSLQYGRVGVKVGSELPVVLQNSTVTKPTEFNLSLHVKDPIAEEGTNRLSLPLLWHDYPVHTT